MSMTALAFGSMFAVMPMAEDTPKTPSEIIESYVQDFRSDRYAESAMLFGIVVPDEG